MTSRVHISPFEILAKVRCAEAAVRIGLISEIGLDVIIFPPIALTRNYFQVVITADLVINSPIHFVFAFLQTNAAFR